jgi:hypothetical protein
MLDFSQDYLIWDNRETIRYISTRKPGPNVEQEVENGCIKQQIEMPEARASGGVYIDKDIHWFVPGVLLPAVIPKAGDKVRDKTGAVWTVIKPWFEDLDQVWDLICRNPIIAFDLQDLIDVWTAHNQADAAAGRIPKFQPKYQAIPARVQEMEVTVIERHGGRFASRKGEVYVAEQLDLRPGEDQVRLGESVFEVETVTGADRIGELMVIGVRQDF